MLKLQYSPLVSFFYNIGTQEPNVALQGRVMDSSGAPLAGATVSASVLKILQATAQSAGDGSYALAPLPPGIYVCTVSLAKYAISARVLTLNTSTAHQDFQLSPVSAAPPVTQVDRPPTVGYTTGSIGSTLKIFDRTAFVAIDLTHKPDQTKMSVVLTHGWVSPYRPGPNGITDWPTKMAAGFHSRGVTASIANIVAWDWRSAASGALPPEENTPSQGVALGEVLQTQLGTANSQQVHFLGHSLGTWSTLLRQTTCTGTNSASNP